VDERALRFAALLPAILVGRAGDDDGINLAPPSPI
jgi:hypothetical protein